MTRARHAAVLLAAGGSSRLGTAKQLLIFDDERLVRRAARSLLATDPCALHVVVGAQGDAVYGALTGIDALRVECADWQRGLSASLRAGISSLPLDIDAALVALCDQPAMDAAHLAALVAIWRREPSMAVASGYAGVLGVPAILPRVWFDNLKRLEGDIGARQLLRDSAAGVRVVSAPALALDIDEPGTSVRL